MRAKLRLPDKYAGMNATERGWALLLEGVARYTEIGAARHSDIVSWKYEAHKFRLADMTWFTPDFEVLYGDGHVELHEVKAVHRPTKAMRARGITKGTTGWKDDARVKFKVAAETFPEYQWVAVEKQLDGSYTTTYAEDLFKRRSK